MIHSHSLFMTFLVFRVPFRGAHVCSVLLARQYHMYDETECVTQSRHTYSTHLTLARPAQHRQPVFLRLVWLYGRANQLCCWPAGHWLQSQKICLFLFSLIFSGKCPCSAF